MTLRLTAINRYPVKSMRGEPLDSALVEPWGLLGDRRWMVVGPSGDCVTAREYPALLLLVPDLRPDGLTVRGPSGEPLTVRTPPAADVKVSVHGHEPFAAADGGDEAAVWLTTYLGTDVRLAYSDDPTRRSLNPSFSLPGDSASFADGYPLLLTTDDSLQQLNEWIADGPLATQGPLPMNRFRPNVVVGGDAPFAEDTWRRIRIGAATFRTPKGCDRCVMTTTDAQTAARGKEPIATLARHRRWDGATWFGMNLIPDTPGVTITVGDEVEILETEESDGPPR